MIDETTPTETPEPTPTEESSAETPETAEAAFNEGMKEVAEDKPAADKPAEPDKEPTPEDKKVVDEKIDAEIKEHRLTKKAAERFRELAARPTQEDMEKAVAPLKALAARAEQMDEVLADTGANAEQIGSAFNYLKAINSGDPVRMKVALKQMTAEVQWLAKQLGEELPAFDPVTDHDDLNNQVDAGELTATVAKEIARLRASETQRNLISQRQTQEQTQKDELKRAYDSAMSDIGILNAKLKSSDPNFAQKLAMLTPTLKVLKSNVHPSKWAEVVEQAYSQLPAITTPTVGAQPIRPTGRTASMRPESNDPVELFRQGVEQASGIAGEY